MTFLYIIALGNKTITHSLLPSFDSVNGRLCQERLLESRNFANPLSISRVDRENEVEILLPWYYHDVTIPLSIGQFFILVFIDGDEVW